MKKALLIAVILGIVAAVYVSGVHQFLSLAEIQQQHQQLHAWVENHYILAIALFFIAYTLTAALALPFAAVITLLAGVLFGIVTGTILVSFASTIGASGAFLIARYIARGALEQRYQHRLANINKALQKDGAYYLFFLRLVPAIPFFLINIGMGLTKLPLKTFYWVSQLGMLPGTIVYVNAGTQLASIQSLADITSPNIIFAFLVLAVFPFFARAVVSMLKARKSYAGFTKPEHFDFNVLVIGGGSAGLVAAYTSSMLKAKTALVERDSMGGDCLNTGCVPSKALLRSAKLAAEIKHASDFGLQLSTDSSDPQMVMQRVQEKIAAIAPNDSVERYTQLGVNCLRGNATVHSPWQVEVDGKTYTTKNIILAMGASPRVPDIDGLADIPFFTTDTIWNLQTPPESLLIIGGGPIGCELGQAFARLGSSVTLIETAERLLPREDADAVDIVRQALESSGVQIFCSCLPQSITGDNNRYTLMASNQSSGQLLELHCSHVLVAVGRQGNTDAVKNLKLETHANGQLVTNDFMQTRFPNVYACGDIVGPHQYTHAASNQAWYAAFNALFSPIKKFRLNDTLLPRAVFTDPEIAAIGMLEQQARDTQTDHEVTVYPWSENDRAVVDEATKGFLKVITAGNSDRILGVTIVGEHASELIAEFLLAMNTNIGLNKILRTIHIYPTRSEIARQVAGKWRKKKFSATAQKWLDKFHRWRLQ